MLVAHAMGGGAETGVLAYTTIHLSPFADRTAVLAHATRAVPRALVYFMYNG